MYVKPLHLVLYGEDSFDLFMLMFIILCTQKAILLKSMKPINNESSSLDNMNRFFKIFLINNKLSIWLF